MFVGFAQRVKLPTNTSNVVPVGSDIMSLLPRFVLQAEGYDKGFEQRVSNLEAEVTRLQQK